MLCEESGEIGQVQENSIHACVLFHGWHQWLQQMLRLVEETEETTQRVVVLVPEQSFEKTQDEVTRYCIDNGHIEFGIVDDLFSGWAEFNVALCQEKLSKAVARSLAEGFSGLRIIIDMSWLADQNLSSKQVESCILSADRMVRKFPLTVFAGYDRQKFSSRRLLNILPFYSSVWVNNSLTDNIYHTNSRISSNKNLQHEALLNYVLSQFEVDAAKLGRSELENALRMLKQIIDNMGDGVIVADANGSLSMFNKKGQEIIGYEKSDLPFSRRVRAFGNYLPDKTTPFPFEDLPITKALRGEQADQVEIFIKNERRPEGRWVSATSRPLNDSSGVIQGAVVVFRDISQKKQSEELQKKLDTRILQTQKLESLGLLAGGIAHDFNNLLMGILGHAGLALEYASVQNKERLQHIQRTAMHLSALTNQLLDFAGQGSFANRPTDVQQLVCELCGMLQPILSKNARLELDFSEESLVVMADPTQLRQVLMNLVTNASDAIENESGTITISTKMRNVSLAELQRAFSGENLEPGDYVGISVEDNGLGISPEKLQKIFDPFYTTKSTGRGLGLAAVLGLVKRHGGALLVESVPQKGSVFEILLPPSKKPLTNSDAVTKIKSKTANPKTILIIDDEEIVRSVAKQILEFAGYSVKVANSGKEGIVQYRENQEELDAVLLDVSMPDMDGREVYSQLREIDSKANIILSSGYSEAEMLQDYSLDGLAGFLQKPYSPEKLIDLVEQLD